MNDESSVTTAPDNAFAARRESVRRSVLRASRAVTGILIVAFLLGAAMVAASYRAMTSQQRAEFAEAQATERLRTASLAQARAERLSTTAGHRAAALAAVSNAAAIRPSVELRNEAIAALGSCDLVREVSWPLERNAYGFYFDSTLEHYVVRYEPGALSMFRLRDNEFVRKFRAADASLPTNAILTEFNFSATGKVIATQYDNGAVVLWERDSGKALNRFGLEPGDEKLAWPPSFNADDSVMFARSASRRDRVLFVSVASGEVRAVTVPGVNGTARLSGPGDQFAWARGRELFLHDSATGEWRKTVPWPAEVASFQWDRAGQQICAWLLDSTLQLRESRTGRVRQLGGKLLGPWVQLFSPDGALLVTAGTDGITRLWDLSEARVIAQTTEGRAFAFGADGERIAFAVPGKQVGVWRVTRATGHRLLQGATAERATAWRQDLSRDGRWLVWAPPPWVEKKGFELFDLASNRPPLWVAQSSHVIAGFHPIEPRLLVAGRDGLRSFTLPASGESALNLGETKTIPLPPGIEPYNFAFSADEWRLVVTDVKGALHVSNVEKPGEWHALEEKIRTPDVPGPASVSGSGALAISPDGRWVIAGRETKSGRPTVWDAQSRKVARTLDGESAHAAFSADGRWLALIGRKECTVWSTVDWTLRWRRPRAPLLNNEGAAAFAADGSMLAFARTADEIELAVPETGESIATLSRADLTTITGLRLSADGRTLVAASLEGRMHAWNLGAIRSELAKMNLDWPDAPERRSLPGRVADSRTDRVDSETGVPVRSSSTPLLLSGVGLGAIGLTGLLGLVVLRRHGRLTREFMQTTELASQQARELAAERELNELKNRFVSMVSHEFRTPLGITMSAVELLRNHLDQLDAAKRAELLEDIFGSTRQMAGLMEQVLLLGRVEAGKLAFRPTPLDLVALCEKLVDESLSATNRRCPIQFHAQSVDGLAQADESLLRHIFSNLLSNAAKYSPAGRPVEFTLRREGRNAVFTIRDRGIGIPEAELPKLFQAFHRATNVGDIQGTGLGLVIVKRCVDLHGGSIEVQSDLGEGTTFNVRLPVSVPA